MSSRLSPRLVRAEDSTEDEEETDYWFSVGLITGLGDTESQRGGAVTSLTSGSGGGLRYVG